jgi:PTH1 family peptidyl-tRNA hydrolase
MTAAPEVATGPYLIVGLGNPGKAYEGTRHNIGFSIVRKLGQKLGVVFHRGRQAGEIAQAHLEGKKVILLLPMTFMNSSGEAVRVCVDYFGIALQQMIVVCDDIALPLGAMRLRKEGGAGGHNGLKSIQAHLSQQYPRLRVGVGDRYEGDLADHVLGSFTQEEQSMLPQIEQRAVEGLEICVKEGLDAAMRKIN